MNHGLYERFLGVAIGGLIANSMTRFELDADVVDAQEKNSLGLWHPLGHAGQAILAPDQISSLHLASLSGLALLQATMPLAIFFHDEPSKWVRLTNLPPQSQILLEAWGQILAAILTDRWIYRLIEQDGIKQDGIGQGDRSIMHIQRFISPTAWELLVPTLIPMQRAIATGISSSDYTTQLFFDNRADSLEIAIALGLFSMGSPPYNFRQAVLRSLHTTAGFSLVGLTGALAGAGLGVRGIPWAWRLRKPLRSPQALLIETMERVWLHWIGYRGAKISSISSQKSNPLALKPLSLDNLAINTLAIASASTLQPRSRLKLVSQDFIR